LIFVHIARGASTAAETAIEELAIEEGAAGGVEGAGGEVEAEVVVEGEEEVAGVLCRISCHIPQNFCASWAAALVNRPQQPSAQLLLQE
jgi:hypothetical protein